MLPQWCRSCCIAWCALCSVHLRAACYVSYVVLRADCAVCARAFPPTGSWCHRACIRPRGAAAPLCPLRGRRAAGTCWPQTGSESCESKGKRTVAPTASNMKYANAALSIPCGTSVLRGTEVLLPYRSALTRCRTHRHSAEASGHSAAKRTGAWSAACGHSRASHDGSIGVAQSVLARNARCNAQRI